MQTEGAARESDELTADKCLRVPQRLLTLWQMFLLYLLHVLLEEVFLYMAKKKQKASELHYEQPAHKIRKSWI